MLVSIALLVTLTSCDAVIRKTEAVEIADINARNALARVERLSSRIEELELKVRSLESEVSGLRSAR